MPPALLSLAPELLHAITERVRITSYLSVVEAQTSHR